jgi:hypothetical protein
MARQTAKRSILNRDQAGSGDSIVPKLVLRVKAAE